MDVLILFITVSESNCKCKKVSGFGLTCGLWLLHLDRQNFDRRSPEHPRKLLTKRLIGLEGDWVAVPGEVAIHRIEKVQLREPQFTDILEMGTKPLQYPYFNMRL